MSRKTGFGQTTLSGEIIRTSDSAVLFDPGDDEPFWVPRRCCLDGSTLEDGDSDICVADWWLEQEGRL